MRASAPQLAAMGKKARCSCGEHQGCKVQNKISTKVARPREKQRVEERRKAGKLAARSVVQGVKGKSKQLQTIAKEKRGTCAKEECKHQAASAWKPKAATKHKYDGHKATLAHPASGIVWFLECWSCMQAQGLQAFRHFVGVQVP
jgi:hypothetical protein